MPNVEEEDGVEINVWTCQFEKTGKPLPHSTGQVQEQEQKTNKKAKQNKK